MSLLESLQPARVLIVDDDASHRTLEREVLSGSQYSISEAANGDEALAILGKEECDVVLVDMRMQGWMATMGWWGLSGWFERRGNSAVSSNFSDRRYL